VTALHGFRGGIAGLPGNKEVSTSQPIQPLVIPPRLYLPIDPGVELLIKPGKRVLAGEVLTDSNATKAAVWHAPVAGRFVEIVDHPAAHPSGRSDPAMVLEPDGSADQVEFSGLGWTDLSVERLISIVESAGIVGMGGAGFPAWLKLGVIESGRLSTLIINGVECEPEISCDDMLIREQADRVVGATAKLAALLQVETAYIAVEDDSPQAMAALKAAEASLGAEEASVGGLELVELPTRYPSGSEKQLIENLLGKQVPKNGLPADLGVLCLNVATLCAIDDAVMDGQPLTTRVVTVSGEAVARPQNRWALFGTPVADLIKSCGGLTAEAENLVMGGPMMGFALASPQTPVIKTTNCILAQNRPPLDKRQPVMPCIRCGDCVDVCPAGLLPQQLYWFAKSGEHDKAQRHNLFDCIECGACAYVCPSQLPLVHHYRAAKSEIRGQQAQRIKADIARERMLARDERLARREQEAAERRLLKRGGRKAGSTDPEAKKAVPGETRSAISDEVAAAMDRAKQLQQQTDAGETNATIDSIGESVDSTEPGQGSSRESGK
jgi:electron transport complex protein RnfC